VPRLLTQTGNGGMVELWEGLAIRDYHWSMVIGEKRRHGKIPQSRKFLEIILQRLEMTLWQLRCLPDNKKKVANEKLNILGPFYTKK
jgi:hypothetical protein